MMPVAGGVLAVFWRCSSGVVAVLWQCSGSVVAVSLYIVKLFLALRNIKALSVYMASGLQDLIRFAILCTAPDSKYAVVFEFFRY